MTCMAVLVWRGCVCVYDVHGSVGMAVCVCMTCMAVLVWRGCVCVYDVHGSVGVAWLCVCV